VLVHDLGLVPGNRVLLRGFNGRWMAAAWLATLKAGTRSGAERFANSTSRARVSAGSITASISPAAATLSAWPRS